MLLLLGAPQAPADVFRGRVIRVIDGDTIEVRKGPGGKEQNIRVRFFAIDAPESKMPWGSACREFLAEMVAAKDVEVRVRDRDRYGRTVGQVFVSSKDVNFAMVEGGCAWHYKQYARKQGVAERRAYIQAELAARAAKKRLWQDGKPEEPWAFRRKHRRR